MEASAVISAISNVGFPIAMVLLMGWFIVQTTKSHQDDVKSLAEIINRNTDAISDIKTMLETALKFIQGGQ